MHSHPSRITGIVLTVGLVLASPLSAAEPVANVPSLGSTPANVAFYSTSLRLGEQMDKFVASKAFAKLRELPAVKAALKHVHDEIDKPDNPVHHVMHALHDPANRELMQVVHDALRQEIFVYGGGNWNGIVKLAQELNGLGRIAPAMAALRGENPQKAQLDHLIKVLGDAGDKLQVPETVIGFRIAKSEPVWTQINRLEEVLIKATENGPLKGRVQRARVAGVGSLVLSLDGSLIPWDQIPDRTEEMDKLFALLKKLTLKVCLLVKGDYLLLAFGPTTAAAESFGSSPALATRPELAPLAKHADKPLLAVSYTSESLAAAASPSAEDIKSLAEIAKDALDQSPLTKERRDAIVKDVRQLVKDMASGLSKPAATISCTFSTAHGQETFAYNYGAAPTMAERPLTLAEHVGGSPLIAVIGVTGDALPDYKTATRWLKVFHGHIDATIQEVLGDDFHKQFHAGMDLVRPLIERFDSITRTQMLPALGDGELAIVIDGKWSSKHWFPGADQGGESLPMIELGAVRTVKNADELLKSLGDFRQWVNDVIDKARDNGVPIPPFSVPTAETKKLPDGTAFFWPMPTHGQDLQILPNLAMSSKFVVKSLSLAHTERLLKSTPLDVQGTKATDRPLQSMAVIDFAGLIGVARPWVEKLALPRMLANVPENAPPGLTAKEIPDQVRTVFDVLQCLRFLRSTSYREGGANVTHIELVIEDLK